MLPNIGSPYHPQSTGQAEKTKGLIMARIRIWLSEGSQNWDQYIPATTLVVNSQQSERLKMSPMEALFGKTTRSPSEASAALETIKDISKRFRAIDDIEDPGERLRILGSIHDEATRVTAMVNERMKKRFGRTNDFSPFRVGTLVLVRNRTKKKRKFTRPWFGPDKIVSVGELRVVRLRMSSRAVIRRNVHDLKPYYKDAEG